MVAIYFLFNYETLFLPSCYICVRSMSISFSSIPFFLAARSPPFVLFLFLCLSFLFLSRDREGGGLHKRPCMRAWRAIGCGGAWCFVLPGFFGLVFSSSV
ncbi:hypothetical protein B0J13DRAFT_117281 [Dactylonectria estremocensis]|uniref:Transmembrane protein n=1 Tax=Dactylonectria estremocensis TaxID=1079267 RepID=A0A9P9FDP9_9HYPO|nr:hypothetical protein B0J13DRAFT_117281 [Dactylonectria estremocensis]